MSVAALPAPTPTELAAIRARLQRRSWPHRQAPYGSAALPTTTQVVLMGGGLVLILVAVFVGSAPVAGAAMSLFQAGLALTWWLDDLVSRATDRTVVERLRAEGIRPAGRRTRRLGLLPAVVAALVGCAQVGTVLLVTSVLSPAPVAAFAAIGPVVLLAVHVALVRRDLQMPGVTGTAVLDAVDDALARTGVAGRLGMGSPFVVTLMPILSNIPDSRSTRPVEAVAFLSGIAAFCIAPLVLRRDRPLMEDARLRDVTPAPSWLAGSPALMSPSGSLPR